MITDILRGKVLVESHGKPAGIYTFDDFSDEELQEEKGIIIGQLFGKKLVKSDRIYDMVATINGVLDKRKLDAISNRQDYFDIAKDLALLEAGKVKK